MNKHVDYYSALSFLESLGKLESPLEYMRDREPKDLKKYLFRMQELLNRLGNPEKDLKYIHITGTAGKGTTVALIHTMLKNAGYKVGSITSPATTTTIERIRINDLFIKPSDFVEIVDSLKPAIQEMYLRSEYGKPSYFDIILAIALIYFKKERCDWVVLEVGMGGRYDSTNVIPSPKVSAITNIGYDHTHLLGNELEKIANEKAGIIKKGSAFFTTEKSKDLLRIFEQTCIEKDAEFIIVESEGRPNDNLVTAIGKYLEIEKNHIDNALAETELPCRVEVVSQSPYIILDGAHNLSKVQYSLKKLNHSNYEKLHVVFGAGDTKDALGMLDSIAPLAHCIYLCPVVSSMGKTFSLKTMEGHLKKCFPQLPVSVHIEPTEALTLAQKQMEPNDCLLVIGSLYLAGGLRKNWYPEDYILENRKSF